MFPIIFAVSLLAYPGGDEGPSSEAQRLLDTIESLQQPIEDFRCEFEGSFSFRGKAAENEKQNSNAEGLSLTYSGIFLWKKGGDTHLDSLHRFVRTGQITREILVVRMRDNQAESYTRDNDASLGSAVIKTPKEINSWRLGSLGKIFLIDTMKRDVADKGLEASVEDDQIDGRPLKVLSFKIKTIPTWALRYWIDLRRNGHVVRQEIYASADQVRARLDVKLAAFKVGDTEVWMPVAGESVGYGAIVDRRPQVFKEPQVLESFYVVDGTMEFNKHPGPKAFTIKYKLGTPISDHLRKMETEFGRQKIAARPTKRDAENMLNEQVANAEAQKSELVVASSSEGSGWWAWGVGGLGGVVLISLAALWIQKRGH